MKEQLKGRVEYCSNNMRLIKMSEIEFTKKIEEIYNQKREV